MMYNEFTELSGIKVHEEYYHVVIEPRYDNSPLDNREFVKEWKKQGGIAEYCKCITDENLLLKERVNSQKDDYKVVCEQLGELRDELDATKEALVIAEQKKESNWDMYKRSTLRIDELEAQERKARREKRELMYFLIEQSEKSSNAELREFVINEIGFKEYITYKFEQNMNIWQLDRDEILKNL